MLWQNLADLILVTHVLFVGFVVLGFVLMLIGLWRRWTWVRNPWFRGLHGLAIGFVVLQAWLGARCPLTVWENSLRVRAGQSGYSGSFIQEWLWRLLYWDAPPWVFTLVYTVFGAAVLLTWWMTRPTPRGTTNEAGSR